MPRPVEALPWGYRSISSTGSPAAASAVARLMAVVVLPTPPFWLAIAMMRGRGSGGRWGSTLVADTADLAETEDELRGSVGLANTFGDVHVPPPRLLLSIRARGGAGLSGELGRRRRGRASKGVAPLQQDRQWRHRARGHPAGRSADRHGPRMRRGVDGRGSMPRGLRKAHLPWVGARSGRTEYRPRNRQHQAAGCRRSRCRYAWETPGGIIGRSASRAGDDVAFPDQLVRRTAGNQIGWCGSSGAGGRP